MTDTRKCKACSETKPLGDYYFAKGKPMGYCKPCWSAYNRASKERVTAAGLPADDERHGSLSGYIYWKCRCDPCRQANSEYQAKRRGPTKARRRHKGTGTPIVARSASEGHTGALTGRYSTGPACKGVPTKLFYPAAGDQAWEAKAICQGCSERIPCAKNGIDGNEYGIWGGTGPDQRASIRRAMKKAGNPELTICLQCDQVSVIDTDDPASSRCWNCGSHHEIDGAPQR